MFDNLPSFTAPGVTIHHADCLDICAQLPANSFDSCVTDPPYHLASVAKRYGRSDIEDSNTRREANPSMTPREMAQRLRRDLDSILHILRDARRKGQIDVRPGDGPRLRKRAGIEASQ